MQSFLFRHINRWHFSSSILLHQSSAIVRPVESYYYSTELPTFRFSSSVLGRRPLRYQHSVFRHRPKARFLRYAPVGYQPTHTSIVDSLVATRLAPAGLPSEVSRAAALAAWVS